MRELELREIPADDWSMIERIGRLRVRAWATEVPQAARMNSWLDEFDRAARHWAFLRNGEPVAAARLSFHRTIDDVPDFECYAGLFRVPPLAPMASLNRLVVDPTVRGRGLCDRLDRKRLKVAESVGCRCALVTTPSGERRVQHLMKLGFTCLGTGRPHSKPPACFLPPPIVLIHRLEAYS